VTAPGTSGSAVIAGNEKGAYARVSLRAHDPVSERRGHNGTVAATGARFVPGVPGVPGVLGVLGVVLVDRPFWLNSLANIFVRV